MKQTLAVIPLVFLFFLTSLNSSFAAIIISTPTGGEWNAPTTWQGGNLPTEFDDAVISSGSTVTISTAGFSSMGAFYTAVCKSLTINGTLTYSNNRVIIGSSNPTNNTLSGGNSPFIVNGTFNMMGDYNNSFNLNGYLQFNSGCTFNMSSGSFIINGTTTVAGSSVPSGIAIVDFSNATNFNFTGGTLSIKNPHFVAGEPCIKGAKAIGFSGTVAFGHYENPVNANDYIVSTTATPTFYNVELNYTSTINRVVMQDVTILGAVSVSKGTLFNPSTTTNLRIGKDINMGSLGKLKGNFEFNGIEQQNINGLVESSVLVSSAVLDGNLIANNNNRVKIKLDFEIINGNLIFQKGKFDANSFKLTLPNSPINYAADKHVVTLDLYSQIGSLIIKNVASATVFPIGTEQGTTTSSYLPVTITASGGDFSASVVPSTNAAVIPAGAGFDRVNHEWDIKRISGTSAADILFQWNAIDEASNFASNRATCKAYHYVGGSWVAVSTTPGTTSAAGGIFTKLAQNITTFSPFALFTPSVLPVSLQSFSGKSRNKSAYLQWTTASEQNNKGFDVEKTTDGIHFKSISFVKGAGNSATSRSYAFVDSDFNQTTYYRLKQTDFDGQFSYSNTITLTSDNAKNNVAKAFPNPLSSNDPLSILPSLDWSGDVSIQLTDVTGRTVYQQIRNLDGNILTIETNNLSNGLYFLQLKNGLEVQTIKVVKK